ncbi:hypothetical protein Efla_004668 [Eimeria flavescens]
MTDGQQQEAQQAAGASGALQGPPEALPSDAQKVLDRQIRLWGLEAQRKLLQARVLVVGLSAINVEASKDLALAGVSQTLCDGRPWNPEEMRFNFLPVLAGSPLDPSCTTAEASKKGLESIASFVTFSAISPDALRCMDSAASSASQQRLQELVKDFACVCVAAEMFPVHSLGPLASACRKCGVCCGGIGFFTQDFGTYELANKGQGAQTTVSHPPLLDVLTAKLADLNPKVDPAIFALLALLRWEAQQQKPRRPLGSIDPLEAGEAAEVETAAATTFAAEGLKPSDSIQRALRDLALGYNQQANATAAVVGGLLAQEVRKYITKEQKAVPNVVVFDSHSSCAAVARVPPLNS